MMLISSKKKKRKKIVSRMVGGHVSARHRQAVRCRTCQHINHLQESFALTSTLPLPPKRWQHERQKYLPILWDVTPDTLARTSSKDDYPPPYIHYLPITTATSLLHHPASTKSCFDFIPNLFCPGFLCNLTP